MIQKYQYYRLQVRGKSNLLTGGIRKDDKWRRWGLNSTLRNDQEFRGQGWGWRDYFRWRQKQEKEGKGRLDLGNRVYERLHQMGRRPSLETPEVIPGLRWLLPYYLLMLYSNHHSSSFPKQIQQGQNKFFHRETESSWKVFTRSFQIVLGSLLILFQWKNAVISEVVRGQITFWLQCGEQPQDTVECHPWLIDGLKNQGSISPTSPVKINLMCFCYVLYNYV